MDDRLMEIERRHAKAAAEDRSATMLRSLKVPRAAWPTSVPSIAVLAVHRKQQVPIAGSSFREDAIEATLGRQSEWSGYGALIPEPSNPHDRHAVAVWSSGRKLGYIPQTTSSLIHTELSDLLRQGTALAVRLTLFRTDRGVGGRVKIAFPLTTRAP
jgi:hypothetical protein